MKAFFRLFMFIAALVWCANTHAESQKKMTSYQKYIKEYKDLAIDHMYRYKMSESQDSDPDECCV